MKLLLITLLRLLITLLRLTRVAVSGLRRRWLLLWRQAKLTVARGAAALLPTVRKLLLLLWWRKVVLPLRMLRHLNSLELACRRQVRHRLFSLLLPVCSRADL